MKEKKPSPRTGKLKQATNQPTTPLHIRHEQLQHSPKGTQLKQKQTC